jgi:hypothetical protein
MRKLSLLRPLVLVFILSGCAITPRYPVPEKEAGAAHFPKYANVRVEFEQGSTNLSGVLKGFLGEFNASLGPGHQIHILALSGGGENGAYGAGLLCGWTEAGTRPDFDLVTGISTGSLIAPLAFLGTNFDSDLRHGYTEIKPEQIFLKRSLFGFLKHRDAGASSEPLQQLIAETIGDKEMTAIAAEHRKGRRLLVMTSNLDAQKPVIWDIGGIAASGEPGALQFIHKILLASASIPAVFPPVMFDVEVGTRHYDEMHVDGGVMAQAFGGALLLPYAAENKTAAPIEFYLIRNGRLGSDYKATPRKLSAIAGRSVGTLMKVQGVSDVLRAWMFSKIAGSHFHFISMPDEFQTELKEPFDPVYMKALFDVGHQQGQHGVPWRQTPPGLPEDVWSPATNPH